ncbi:MAG: ribosome biogenesis GTP-binding protein YihA/YsxC [Arcobacter sp.]|jgi:GTP-binding protein|uniref:Probable GTP-binding protein EngB n=1 Tax=Arcobacter defluvii TaxID=873191 RepID=A0AAE7E7D2_9BACT|nr:MULTISPECIES: ribosome biogenesis GTP-binding protein YihA/YsxC [Arcobacter]MDY3200602.1 ribosome biogenesis GTP-binding protein YihA/YsxC [Arcobacter sp.]QKF77228.1 ribosome biogenesis GTP-binding protein YsxC/EngB [Arcobacter defluvii]RXI33483.1 YihA family ribosome biogenesis GTP-binding protein [Arcobacter defluvii]BAK73109.1 putative ATP /GTP binding protein [Arcobacter sp. L]
MKIVDAKFLQSAQSVNDSPAPNVAEVAFLGRSNVGKSSLLNTLTNRKGLAKSSSTPGKTQLINYFEIKFKTENEEMPYLFARFVDLPGFGYAKVAKSLKAEWNRNLTGYLELRPNLQIFVHLIDSRHPELEIDKNVDEFLLDIKRGDQIIVHAFTKTDKLKQNELAQLKRVYPDGIFISNLKKRGIIDLQNKITGYLFGN